MACGRSIHWRGCTAGTVRPGFSLVELLVATAVIALLVSVLLPALSSARKAAAAANSLSNVRQWGVAELASTDDHRSLLPWEGTKHNTTQNFAEPLWWGNVVPLYVGERAYSRVSTDALAAGEPVPLPPQTRLFVDPAAVVDEMLLFGPAINTRHFLCYIPNANLSNTPGYSYPLIPGTLDRYRVPLHWIRKASATVLVFERRTTQVEIPAEAPDAGAIDVHRMKGDAKHLAGRHLGGGNVAFADGHAARIGYRYANSTAQGYWTLSEDAMEKPDLRWRLTPP